MPPVSSCTFARRVAAACSTRSPLAAEPVKLSASTKALSTSAWPTSRPLPITRLKAPAGRPARLMISASAQPQAGTSSAGLNTTLLPWASAGAIFQAGITKGAFHGVMSPVTPTASRVTSTCTPARVEAMFSPPPPRSASPAKNLKT